MKNEKRSFKDRYSNDWICTLKQVAELKGVILSKTTEEVRFSRGGTWSIEEENHLGKENEFPKLKLSKEELYCINQSNINELINNICCVIFGLDQSLNDKEVHEFYVRKNTGLLLNLSNSFEFVFNRGNYDFSCKIEWESYNRYLLVILDDETVGFARDIRHLINFLFDLSKQAIDNFYVLSLFWNELKKFEDYYYYLINESIPLTFRPTTEIMIQNKYPWELNGEYRKIKDVIKFYGLDEHVTIPENINQEHYMDEGELLFWHEREYGYFDRDIEELAHLFLCYLELYTLVPFEIRKEKCLYTNNHKILIDKEYIIEWNKSEGCFRIISFNFKCNYFNGPECLIEYLLSLIPNNINKKIKKSYYNKIEKFAYVICKDSSADEYKDLVDLISNYDQRKISSDDIPF
ncbi:hypothetical protein NC661_03040 [Aquibacillus koreensis]|uniref:Uncharacterized protein n=1 Tax=Aquibacillus koreensis TaxID=279446 RepID=A0A9X3WI21_9BACI|nr:hypothetical protein [Aquibacillus koreensis]MCT2536843.1 hypothetical protein [Aquibacillus koreensis]MDC3419338.1 hypothetical protein [Aquibacillus koreensis]